MLKKLLAAAVVLAAAGGGAFWVLTEPKMVRAEDLPQHQADLANGERLFHAGGCAGCHAAPGAKGEEKSKLGGGLVLDTPFGKFHVPNISPDKDTGIGEWSTAAFVGAMKNGVDDEGEHLYPAFPYASYTHMTVEDLIDLKGYLDTLPAVSNPVPDHELSFPFNIRRGLGLWKILYLSDKPFAPLPADASAEVRRGQYLVEGPGHCGECHTSRTMAGGIDRAKWLAGAPNPEGKGVIPNITSGPGGIGDWSEDDIVNALQTGFKPDYDSFGGSMVEVQENVSQLPEADLKAIAAYLKAVPKLPSAVKAAEGG